MQNELTWTPFRSLLKKEIARFMRVIVQTILIPLVNSFLYLLIFGVSLGSAIQTSGGMPYLSFLIPGIVMMAVLNNAFQNSSSSVITSKFHGDLEDLRMVPLSPIQVIAAFSLGGLIRGLMVGLVVWAVGQALHVYTLGTWLPTHNIFILLLFLTVGGLAFAQLGITIAFVARTFDQMSAFGGFILLPLMYLGGVFFSLDQLHPFWRYLSQLNPMLYFINGVRYGMLGHSDIAWTQAAYFSIASLAVVCALAWRSINKGNYGRW
ncbi:MAG TPA: ABC transporter permease [Bdellovibrionales bacterium]|nr:ABC transporter permease [Bdellovibrionales bacterium]